MQVSYAIQAHPARTDMAEQLAGDIGGPVDIVYDPDPNGYKLPWRTYRHLLETTPDWATHRFQIQDDATVCRNLRVAVDKAVEAQPDRLLIFFVPGGRHHHAGSIYQACERDEPWAQLEFGHWCPCVATCWPVGLIPQVCSFVDRQTHWPEKFGADDEIVGRFIREIGHRPLATVPSLVEHADIVHSLLGKKARGGESEERVAACWIGNCADCDDAALIDWTVTCSFAR